MDANGLYGSSASEDGQLSCEEREDGKMLDEDEDQPGEKREWTKDLENKTPDN